MYVYFWAPLTPAESAYLSVSLGRPRKFLMVIV